MFDRIYVFALIALAVVFGRDLITLGVPLLLMLTLLVAIPLFLFEGLANFLSPKLQRDLITFRYKPNRAIPKLVRHLELDRPQTAEALKEKATALSNAAQAVNLRHPNPIYRPLRQDRLARALDPALHPDNKAFGRELAKAWRGPKPGATLGGIVLRLRASLGRLLFGKWIDIARRQTPAWATSVITGRAAKTTEHPWQTPDYPGALTFYAWKDLADANGLSAFDSDPAWLPLSGQRKLAALTAQLFGTPTEALLARLLNPSFFKGLQKIAADRAKWQSWSVEQQQADAQRRADQEERARFRGDSGLSADEITTLITERAQDSILLNRLWPPGTPVTTNSWLGGLPCLPPEMNWPRSGETNLPLHFLTQVDCADLPTLNGTSPLPRDGLLLFFSDLDEERRDQDDSRRQAVVYVPKARQSVPPRALPDDLPEIDHSGGKPGIQSDGRRAYPKWPVVPVAVKVWGGEEIGHPRTANHKYLDQSRAAHDASLAAVMPPPVASQRLASIFPTRQRKDAEGKTILTPEGHAIPYAVFDPTALPEGFPFCGAGIEAFVTRLQQEAAKAARKAARDQSFIDTKWNDTKEKRARQRAEADESDARARALAALASDARAVLGTLPPLAPVPKDSIARLHGWLSGLVDQPSHLHGRVQTAVSGSLLDLARSAVTDPALAARLPDRVFAAHATSLLPSPNQSQHLMLGPAQVKTNSTAGSGVRLLCLDSDYGPGMMFCDCGVLEYWIDPADLAAGRFERAYANTAGG